MPTAIAGNSKILIGMDHNGSWTELFYPYVGKYQNIRCLYAGLYNSKMTWFKDAENRQYYLDSSSVIVNEHKIDGFSVLNTLAVHPNHDVIVSSYTVKNLTGEHRQAKLYIYENLKLAERAFRDSVVYDDELNALVHFKEDLYFIFKGIPDFSSYTCGETEIKGLSGAHADACDGKLEKHCVTNGSVDACMEFQLSIPPFLAETVRLLIIAAENYKQAKSLLKHVFNRIPEIEEETEQFWKSWTKRAVAPSITGDRGILLNNLLGALYKRSLMVIELHSDANGGIIASSDSSSLNIGGDTYNYVWWRDGALISMAMDAAGYHSTPRSFFEFAKRNQSSGGFFLHRHLPNGPLGSTWHRPPFIQIDQTGSIIKALDYHYQKTLDINFLRSMWSMVKNAADFLVKYRDENGLPKPSYDLWEERFGTFTYSAASVCTGLHSAATIAQELGKYTNRGQLYDQVAGEMKEAILDNLYSKEKGYFLKSINPYDATVDASILGLVLFDVIDPRDERISSTIKTVEQRLLRNGGIARYEGDRYCGDMNPWIICTLWLAETLIKKGEVDRAISYISWAANCQLNTSRTQTGLLPEQIAPDGYKSVMPLVWSHACFVWTMHQLSSVIGREQRKKQSYTRERLIESRSSIS